MKFSEKVSDFVDRISLRVALQCTVVTFGVCGMVLAGAFVFTGHTVLENGQGGYDYPGNPIAQEMPVAEVFSIDTDTNFDSYVESENELSYFSYRIKQGDMIGRLANQFNITEDTIISVNNIHSSRTIQIGDYLKIPSKSGILYTVKTDNETIDSIAEKYEVDAAECASVNHVAHNVAFEKGTTVFVPDAVLDAVTKQEINGDLLKKPIHGSWYKSSSFGWRSNPFTGKRTYHNGLDMACAQGTTVYSAFPGKVVEVGFNSVYGNYIIITNGTGYKALYGHMKSKSPCRRGQVVNQSTVIGYVGSTGMSTGPHLHFTLYKNGKLVNPAAYWN